jgi:nucleoside 2-deoxyribosyltransferase
MFNPYQGEGLYIAGPECFYIRGYDLWWAQRKLAEYYGIPVVLPTSTCLKLDQDDLRLNAKEIFDDLVVQVEKTTAIIADLEFFRGCEADGGTLFEMGWIWSKGGRIYGYTRDMRIMAVKNQAARLVNQTIIDQTGGPHPYVDLPFCPSVVASAKLVEGDFNDALKFYLADLDETRKGNVQLRKELVKVDFPQEDYGKRVFLSLGQRYRNGSEMLFKEAKALCEAHGYIGISPLDEIEGFDFPDSEDPYTRASFSFIRSMSLLNTCGSFVADLSDFHGWEPNNDVSFECGVAYGLGKKCIGFLPDARKMRDRIPHFGEKLDNRDWCGNSVENFDYPINLMFSCSMPIVEGGLGEAVVCL